MAHPTTSETPAWAAALGRIPSGLFIVTVRHVDRETGMLASWVQQCSFDPPLVSVAVNNERYVLDWLTNDTAFAVNVIPHGEKSLIAHFGKGFGPDEPAFTGQSMLPGTTAPALASALAHVECVVVAKVDAGDHTLVIGRVTAGTVHTEGTPATHVRKSGLRY